MCCSKDTLVCDFKSIVVSGSKYEIVCSSKDTVVW